MVKIMFVMLKMLFDIFLNICSFILIVSMTVSVIAGAVLVVKLAIESFKN